MTQCIARTGSFKALGSRRVEAAFDGGRVTSDAGLLLLAEVGGRTGIVTKFAACFEDHRNPALIEHSVPELVSQRTLGLACGYEDLNDHDVIRDDSLMATAVGKTDPEGRHRKRECDIGHALASRSTLNRLELTPPDAGQESRYKKIVIHEEKVEELLVEHFLDAFEEPPREIILDLDATDDPLHGKQEGRFFHGYYRCYCYLPLYIFCGDHLLCAKLRTANIDAASGSVEEVQRITQHIRQRWPDVEIVIRGDSGFSRDNLMTWCEDNGADFVLGQARNPRLRDSIEEELALAKEQSEESGEPARVFKDFRYRTLDSWTRERRVVGKAEHIPGKANPRFVVTSFSAERYDARELYEDLYCLRGDMENRIKEQQLALFADRTSTSKMRSNQIRLWFSSIAYVLINDLRRIGLVGTQLEKAQAGTIRTRLLKIGAVVTVSVRRVRVALSSVFPLQHVFWKAYRNILAFRPLRI